MWLSTNEKNVKFEAKTSVYSKRKNFRNTIDNESQDAKGLFV